MNWIIFLTLSLISVLALFLCVKYRTLGNRLIASFTLILVASSLLLTGLDYQTGEQSSFIYEINSTNVLTQSTEYTYSNYNTPISKGLSLIILFLGVLLLFYSDFDRFGIQEVLK